MVAIAPGSYKTHQDFVVFGPDTDSERFERFTPSERRFNFSGWSADRLQCAYHHPEEVDAARTSAIAVRLRPPMVGGVGADRGAEAILLVDHASALALPGLHRA